MQIWNLESLESRFQISKFAQPRLPDFQICTIYVSRFQISGNLESGNLESGNIGRANLEIWNLETSVLEIWNLERLVCSVPCQPKFWADEGLSKGLAIRNTRWARSWPQSSVTPGLLLFCNTRSRWNCPVGLWLFEYRIPMREIRNQLVEDSLQNIL